MDEEITCVVYQGETVRLSRTYADFPEYRDDPNNLPASEIPRIASLLKDAPVPARFATREAAGDFLFTLMFPGYGFSLLQLGKPVAMYSLEVPQMNEDRWITAVPQGQEWLVIDDFVWPTARGYIRAAEYDGKTIRYFDRSGAILRER